MLSYFLLIVLYYRFYSLSFLYYSLSFARLVTDRKDEVFEADIVESKWNAMKGVWQKATEQVSSAYDTIQPI